MKKLFVILAFLFMSFALHSQLQVFHKINYENIEKAIAKENSSLFYPKLMERFLNADTTMSIDEKIHLYYGFVFHENYSPYGISDYNKELQSVIEKQTLQREDYEAILELTDSILSSDPFNLNAYNYQLYALESLEMEDKYNTRVAQIRMIMDAVFNTGDGKTKENAIWVISPEHEYFILPVLGFEFGGEQSLIETYDRMEVQPNQYGIEAVYFEVSASLDFLNRSIDE